MRIEDWLRSRFDVRGEGVQLRVNCPMCSKIGKSLDVKHHMGVSLRPDSRLQGVHCFRCGYHASLLRFVSDIEGGLSYREIKERFRLVASVNLQDGNVLLTPTPKVRTPTKRDKFPLPKEYREMDPQSRLHFKPLRYLAKRGYTDLKFLKRFGVGYCATGDYAGRLIIPIVFEGEQVCFTARAIEDSAQPRYKFPPGSLPSLFVYNYDNAALSDTVVLMEGPFDVWTAPNSAIGLFTNQISIPQRLLVVTTWSRAVVMLDRDAADRSYKIYQQLSQFMPCTVTHVDAKDPGEAGRVDVFRAALRNEGLGVMLCDRS